MTPAARAAAAIEILDRVIAGAPAERELTNWARRSRFAGSGDRAAVRDIVFDCIRRMRSLAALGGGQGGRALVLGWCRAQGLAEEEIFSGARHAPAPLSEEERRGGGAPADDGAALDLPDWLWPRLRAGLGEARARAAALALRERAPLDIRVNLARIGRDAARQALAEAGIATEPVQGVASALRAVGASRKVATSPLYRDGLIELQDAASQAVVEALPLSPGMRVLDLCAGGGGKALAMAAREPGIALSAWDAAPARLAPLAERAARAGAAIRLLEAPPRSAEFDLVLADVPCSGSGAWRRSPEGKWRLTEARLAELLRLQGEILGQAWALVAPGGVLAYATCSILPEENEDAISAFRERQAEAELLGARRFDIGHPGDGFFRALLRKPG